nr:MAG TPA: hypothetical protein [Inoviridae sp.]
MYPFFTFLLHKSFTRVGKFLCIQFLIFNSLYVSGFSTLCKSVSAT